MRIMFKHGLVFAVCLSASSLALAIDGVAVQSSVSIDNLSYTLKDLNTLDGTAPSFTPSNYAPDNQTMLVAGSYVAYSTNDPKSVRFTSLPFDSSSQLITGPDFTAASKSANNLAVKTNLMLPTVASAVQGTDSQNLSVAAAMSSSTWTLGAGTQVTIQGTISSSIGFDTAQLLSSGALPQGTLSAATDFSWSFYQPGSLGSLYIDGGSGSTGVNWNIVQGGAYFENGSPHNDLPVGSLSKTFALTASNTGSSAMTLNLNIGVGSLVSWATPAAVPEPSTYILMTMGLGLMAWRVRTARRG